MIAGLTGAPAMPANRVAAPTSAVSSAVAPAFAALPGSVGDAPASSGPTATSAATRSLIGSLSAVDAAALPAYVNAHRSELNRLLVDPPAAADAARMWRLLDPAKRSVLVQTVPHVIGNLEGVPYAVRGQANTLDLKRTIASAKSDLGTQHGRTARIALQRKLTTLGNVEKALAAKDGDKRTLIALDPGDDARASIVVGDLSTATYVSVLVPGMYMSVGEQIEGWARVAQDLHDQQTEALRRMLGPRGSTPPGVAVVAWIGYQTPVLTNIGGMQLAEQGADSLERTLLGIQSIRRTDPPYLSLFAHSYGSTAALLALERGTVRVDALALMGSPGSDAQSVAGLSVAGGNVFVGEAPLDPIVHSAFFGSDPGSPSYGARSMGVDGSVDPLTHVALAGSSGHNEYFTAGTESIRNLAMIGIDRGDLVIPASSDPEGVATQTAAARG
ncbi:alpha/beta hydrolase [Leifsonia sp. AG29]|uniref:alpha/beta hydrolase n=1 Tax=Leifsonia sp. AG29 TaxID=2598860 RepID=UPI001E482E0C|nr:alpha/beta hydrolase [Leifsonia sp. AG29]